MRNFLIRLLGGITKTEYLDKFDFIRSLIKNWDEFREDSNLLLLNYPQIKENEFWILGHFDVRDKYFAHLYKLQNGNLSH